MANNMELVLIKPVEKLIPELIGFNNEELLNQVNASLEGYRGVKFDEDTITEAKNARAKLNKFADSLNAERLRIKKVYTAPLDKFTEQINVIINAVASVSSEIDVQIKTFDLDRQNKKLEEIKQYYLELLPKELIELVSYEQIHKKEWLNVSKSISNVKKEVEIAVKKITEELHAIELLESDNEIKLKQIYFKRLNLSEAIQQYEADKAENARVEALLSKPNNIVTKPQVAVNLEDEKQYSVSFKVIGSKSQLENLAEYLKSQKIHYEKI